MNIHSNKYVIVQQEWLRKIFKEKYSLKNVIVAYPDISIQSKKDIKDSKNNKPTFFYPAYPRVFKNMEVLFEAAKLLNRYHEDYEIIVTLDGSENKYSRYLKTTYGHIKQIKFIGLQPRNRIFELYHSSSCIVFPSKLETWGLPITEAKFFEKPLFVANCAYAKETVGNYNKVCFFNPNDPIRLSSLMRNFIEDTIKYDETNFTEPEAPFTKTWKELFSLLLTPL
jgi:glycosyltransferase involved in cell wall biosynthesis